jgi:hypothetical protein
MKLPHHLNQDWFCFSVWRKVPLLQGLLKEQNIKTQVERGRRGKSMK